MKTKYFLVLSVLLPVFVSASVYGQQYTVKGTVTASGEPVRYAMVTFIDGYTYMHYTAETDSTGAFNIGTITGVKASPQEPASFKLEQNYPNPFASKTAISYDLEKKSDVKVTIYDVLGRVVKRYSLGYQDAGVHGIIWDGRNMLDRRVVPGVYFYRLQASGRSEVRKMLFGIGAPNAAVSLSGMLPSRTFESGIAKAASSQSEPFTVMLANTDSTSPLIVAGPIYSSQYVRVGSDTTLTLPAQKLNPATVYADSTAQLIEGFGGANTVNWQDNNFTTADINKAFGDGSGDIGLTIMRMRIPPDSSQFIQSVATAKMAESLGAKVIASPWTPPAWMKTNNNTVAGSLKTNEYAAYAAHLKAFADTMAAHGAPVYAVSVQNEPDANVNYESCYWTPTELLNFMRYDAPKVGVPVFMPESQNFITSYSDSTLKDSLACAHTAFVAGHLYGAQPFVYSLALNKGKQVWMTEYLDTSTTWSSDLRTAEQINNCMYDDMSAYVWWWTVDYWSLIDARENVTKRGYVMSQYGRFVRPGYHRVFTTAPPNSNSSGLYWTAYTGNGKTIIVVINANSFSTIEPFTLKNSNVTSFTPYVTSSSKNCLQESSVAVSNGKFIANLDASSVTTFVSN